MGGEEKEKKRRRCSVCGGIGHNARYHRSDVQKAVDTAKKKAKRANDLSNKSPAYALKCAELERQCIERSELLFEQRERDYESLPQDIDERAACFLNTLVTPGSYVEVAADLSPGKCSHGGLAFVSEMRETASSEEALCDYVVESSKEWVSLARITPRIFELSRHRRARERTGRTNATHDEDEERTDAISLLLQLRNELKGVKHGQRRRAFGKKKKLASQFTKEEQQQVFIEAETVATYRATVSPTKKLPNDVLTFERLAKAWGKGVATIFRILRKGRTNALLAEKEKVCLSMIESFDAAKKVFTGRKLFVWKMYGWRAMETPIRRCDRATVLAEMEIKWANLADDTRERWELHARGELAKQPTMGAKIIDLVNERPTRSFRQLSILIGSWCSGETIRRWLNGKGTYYRMMERFVPLLSKQQKQAQVLFATRFRMLWGGIQGQKVLLVHYDEKWFFGARARKGAKVCPELGIARAQKETKNTHFIPKIMMVAFVGFAFHGCIESGGTGIKLGLYRAERPRVCLKKGGVRERRDLPDGTYKFDGAVVREYEEAYMIDCAVTGSARGTPSSPKFDLLTLFKDRVFPKLDALTAAGAAYDGYKVVLQGDNAGPHSDATFAKFLKMECTARLFLLENQAAHMPHANVLDLQVFPSMSKAVDELSALYSRRTLQLNEISECANKAFAELKGSQIARAFILMYRVMGTVIEKRGETGFLSNGSLHYNVRKDFDNYGRDTIKPVTAMTVSL